MARCEAEMTKREENKLPPNTFRVQCEREATGRKAGKNLCAFHIGVMERSQERAVRMQDLRTRRLATAS